MSNVFDLPEGTEGEIVEFYRRENSPTYVVQFPTGEQVLAAHDLEPVAATPEEGRP